MSKYLPNVIFPLIILGSFLISARAASGIPQLATGPQKWVLKEKGIIRRNEFLDNEDVLKPHKIVAKLLAFQAVYQSACQAAGRLWYLCHFHYWLHPFSLTQGRIRELLPLEVNTSFSRDKVIATVLN